MFPLRVAVETVRASHCLSCAHDGHILIDTYAIVSGSTVLSSLVDTVLSALGHPQLALNARGMVQINNWKPLPFEQITDNLDDTVASLFKDVSNQITLRILTKPTTTDSASAQCITDLKQRLLKTAINKNPTILNSIDNQQIKDLITQIIAGDEPTMLNHEQINAINDWLESLDQAEERRSPVTQVRFNPLFETPKLDKWFRQDSNPNRQKLLQYMNMLNSSTFRKNNPKITYSQICNWFNNQRASARRPALAAQQSALNQVNQYFDLQTVLPTMVSTDYRPKIDFNNLIESCTKLANGDDIRVDGGSDSPSPGDDEVHSNSDGANDMIFKQESTASSPDLPLSQVTGPTSISSSSPRHLPQHDLALQNLNGLNSSLGASRSRLMFDPLTELPILERWFEENPHPTWMQIDQYTQTLNNCPYRENYPHISQHNVKIWFKNRRAKCKRMQVGVHEKMDKLFAL